MPSSYITSRFEGARNRHSILLCAGKYMLSTSISYRGAVPLDGIDGKYLDGSSEKTRG
jgi:hypothetical protein